MEYNIGREVSMPLSLRLTTVPVSLEGQSPVVCLRCHYPLEIHQPDSEAPEQMLATCPGCHAWHLLDCQAGAAEVVLVLLPDTALLRKTLTAG